jgi:hypothetical protein
MRREEEQEQNESETGGTERKSHEIQRKEERNEGMKDG